MLIAGLIAGFVYWLWSEGMSPALFGSSPGPAFGLTPGLAFGLFVLAFMLMTGLAGSTERAWPSYMITRAWLALHHGLPWPLMSFLAEAHHRGVLRQAGAVYQFRHIDLQHRLANRAADKQ